MSTRKYTVLSLFAGAGGMDLGFQGGFTFLDKKYTRNPFEIVYANEINKHAGKTYAENFQHLPVVKDIADIDATILPKVDVVIGGFPCQPFSKAGKMEGFGDTKGRGNLYLQMKRVIYAVKPKMFVAENVDGLRTHSTDGVSTLQKIVDDLGEEYDIEYKVLKAVDYGVPQTRVRIIIIGRRKDLKGEIVYPKPTHAIKATSKLKKHVTVKEAIDDLWEMVGDENAPANHTVNDYSKAKFQPGKNYQGNQKEYANKPGHTVRAEAHGNQYAHYNSTGDNPNNEDTTTWRRLTVRECARLQTFPDSFIFPVSQTAAHKQIGNAVPPVLAWHIARNITKTLKDIDFALSLKHAKLKNNIKR